MNWDVILEWIIDVGGKTLTLIGGLTGLMAIIIIIARFFGAKWVDLLFEKCIIRYKYKHDKELAFKTAQYNSLVPEQKVIVQELHRKVLRLQQSTKLFVEWFDVIKEGFTKEPIINEIEEIDNFEFNIEVTYVSKDTKEKHKRIFTVDEIEKIGSYHRIKKEVEEYIEQSTIFIPEDIINTINAILLMINLFIQMNFPKEFIHYWTQDKLDREERNKLVNEIEEIKFGVGFDDEKVIELIDSFFAFIQTQFRILLGVENSNQ